MKLAVLDVLACPLCRGPLTLNATAQQNGEVRSGTLMCSACSQSFPIEEGVPRFLLGAESMTTRRGYDAQWRMRKKGTFEKRGTLYNQDIAELTRWWFSGCLGSTTPGEWLLDLGCGMAEKATVLAREHMDVQVVAMDMGDTIFTAANEPNVPPNLHFVQGDMMHPPLKRGAFAKIVSFGVLHHAPDTREAFRLTCEMLVPAGRLLVWLYPHPDDDWMFARYYHIREQVFRGQAHRIPPLLLLWLVRAYCLVMGPVFHYEFTQKIIPRYRDCPYMHLENLGPLQRYKSLVFVVFDLIVGEHLSYYRRSEILQWFREEGFIGAATDNEGHYWGERAITSSKASG